MPEIFRSRDCVVLVKGDAFPVTVSETMARDGWLGGQGVKWDAPSRDEFVVTLSDGLCAGVIIWGSDETSDKYTSMTRNQVAYRFGTVAIGSWLILTTSYERYTYLSRTGPGPLVPITYTENDRLLFSLRGLWTTEDEWSLSLDPRAPNIFTGGYISQAPSAATDYFMGIEVSI